MKDEERERPGPVGIEALNEMGRRLLDVLGSVEQTFTRDQTSRTRSFTLKTPRGRLAGSIGFAVRHGIAPEQPDRASTRRQVPAPQPKIDGSEGHLIDVFDEPSEILVTIAPCAIGAHELAVSVEGAVLHIEATGGRRFRQQVPLPRDLGDAIPAVPKFWKGLVARWDKAITIAERFPMTPAPIPAIEPTAAPPPVAAGSETSAVARSIDRAADNIKGSNFPPRPDFPPLVTNRQREALFGRYEYVPAPQAGNREAIRILGNWEHDNIVEVPIPQLRKALGNKAPTSIRFHRLAADQLQLLWAEWEAAGLLNCILSFGGGFVARFVRGSRSVLSNHAFGSAFDINEASNPFGQRPVSNGRKGSVRDLVPIANRNGFYWGGHYQSRTDGMHFEIAVLKRRVTPQPSPGLEGASLADDTAPAPDIAASAGQTQPLSVGASPPAAAA